jgi:hypothetical protein
MLETADPDLCCFRRTRQSLKLSYAHLSSQRMANVPPADILTPPEFLDPIFEYLQDNLPPTAYAVLESVLANGLALLSGLVSLTTSLIASKPWEWDAQTILPPVIVILGAYLALLNLYRTTSWMVRTGFWLAKWGTIFAALAGGVGWFMGTAGTDLARKGLMSTVGGMVLDMINGAGQNAAGGTRKQRPRSARKSESKAGRDTPKPYESWTQFRQRQKAENPVEDNADDEHAGISEAQKIMGNIVKAAGRVMTDSGWLDMAKGIVEKLGGQTDDEDERTDGKRKQPPRKSKTKSGNGGSR